LTTSLVTPVFKTNYLPQLIPSIRAQTDQDWEWTFVLDGCTDNKKEIEEAVAADSRIRLIEQPLLLGAGTSLNHGFSQAQGEIGCFISTNCVYAPNFLEKLVGSEVCYSQFDIINEEGNVFEATKGPKIFDRAQLFRHDFVGPSFTFPLHEDLKFGSGTCFDYQLLIQLALKNYQFLHIPEVLYFWRTPPDEYDKTGAAGLDPQTVEWVKQHYHPQFVLCTIMKNEEENLQKWVAKNMRFFDTTILVDTGSTDNSIQVGKDLGADVYVGDFTDKGYFHFSNAKNAAVNYVQDGDFAFVADCDDELTDDFYKLREIPLEMDAVCFPMHDNLPGAENQVHWTWRLFMKHPWTRYENRVHEQPTWIHHRLCNYCGKEWIIRHQGYLDQSKMPDRFKRNQPLLELALEENPNDPTLHFNTAIQLRGENKLVMAREEWEKVIRLHTMSTQLVPVAYSQIAETFIMENKLKDAQVYLEKAVEAEPHLADAHYHLGEIQNKFWLETGDEKFKASAIEHLKAAAGENKNLVIGSSTIKEKAEALLKQIGG
jgi:glycosyltransferase involved in cell wall biosynthesis